MVVVGIAVEVVMFSPPWRSCGRCWCCWCRGRSPGLTGPPLGEGSQEKRAHSLGRGRRGERGRGERRRERKREIVWEERDVREGCLVIGTKGGNKNERCAERGMEREKTDTMLPPNVLGLLIDSQ